MLGIRSQDGRKKNLAAPAIDKAQLQAAARDRLRRRRRQTIQAYGGKCECCGITNFEFLALDHPEGDGKKHRKELGKSGNSVVEWAIRNNFPKRVRVMCHNCNSSHGHYGYCPHKLGETLYGEAAP